MLHLGFESVFLCEKYAYQLINADDYEKLKKTKQLDPYIKKQMAAGRSFFNELSQTGKNRVYYSIMKSAGNANPKVINTMKGVGTVERWSHLFEQLKAYL